MSPLSRIIVLGLLLAVPGERAVAQGTVPAPPLDDWTHGTIVAASVGVAHASSDTGGTAGGALGWEITPRLLVEGSGLWLDRRGGSNGFNAALKVRAGLLQSGVAPFVEGGFGLYRVSGGALADMPDFYRRRISMGNLAAKSFTDPAFHLGGGLNVFVSRHLALQPAAEAIVVRGDGATYTLGAFSLRMVYHFEDHPVTLAR